MSGTAAGRPAVVLFSGGLDSTTLLAYARHHGWDPCALTFRYGQRHASEVAQATGVARSFGVARHVVTEIDLRAFGGALHGADYRAQAIADVVRFQARLLALGQARLGLADVVDHVRTFHALHRRVHDLAHPPDLAQHDVVALGRRALAALHLEDVLGELLSVRLQALDLVEVDAVEGDLRRVEGTQPLSYHPVDHLVVRDR